MAKLQIPNLKPGTSYRIVIEGQGVSGESLVLPSIEFTTPTAPTGASNESLSIRSETVTETTYSDRVIVTNGTCKYKKASGSKVATISTGTKAHGLQKNEKVKVENIGTNYDVASATVLSVDTTKNEFTYETANTTGSTSWTTDTSVTLTELQDSSTGKVKTFNRLNIKIPQKIMNGLIWTDDIRDVVHIVYRKSINKNNIAGKKKKYIFNDTAVSGSSPRTMTFSSSIYDYGMPRISTFDITDNKYYEFQFALARYVKNDDGTWTGYWLEDMANRFSKTEGWSA